MTPWALCDPSEYLSHDLRAHEILENVPLHDVWWLDLPGGGDGRTLEDLRSLVEASRPSAPVRLLFALRGQLGKVFRWDRDPLGDEGLFQLRVTEADRLRSSVATGTKDGPFTVLYVHPTEAMAEIRNATVHAALVSVLVRRGDGYRMLWAIYVKPVGRFTAFYMFLIDPFRRWVVYPSLLRRLHREWCLRYPSAD